MILPPKIVAGLLRSASGGSRIAERRTRTEDVPGKQKAHHTYFAEPNAQSI